MTKPDRSDLDSPSKFLDRWRAWFFQAIMLVGSVLLSSGLASAVTYAIVSAGQGRVIVARLDAMGGDLHAHQETLERHVTSIERMQSDIVHLANNLDTLQQHKITMDMRVVEILTKLATMEERARSFEKPAR
jgi:hypothetical protein